MNRASPRGRRFWRRFAANRGALAGLALLALVVLLAVAAPYLYPGDPFRIVGRPLLAPFADARFPLGTDRLGRDVAAGLAHGARVSLTIGLAAAFAAVATGTVIGLVAGYVGGWVDEILMRIAEAFQTVPSFVLALTVAAVLGPSLWNLTLAIALVSWRETARIVRAECLSLTRRDFVRACRALGAGPWRIMLRHILPNAFGTVIVMASLIVASAILIESALSFLNLGDPNQVSWGGMIAGGRSVLRSAWYLSALPGAAIVITVLAVSLVGEGLADALNPRLRSV